MRIAITYDGDGSEVHSEFFVAKYNAADLARLVAIMRRDVHGNDEHAYMPATVDFVRDLGRVAKLAAQEVECGDCGHARPNTTPDHCDPCADTSTVDTLPGTLPNARRTA